MAQTPPDPSLPVLTKTATFSYTEPEYESAYKQARESALRAHVNFRLLFEDQSAMELQKWITIASGAFNLITLIAVIWKIR